jgi:hypothetical protein
MNQPSTPPARGSRWPARRRLLIIAGILVLSTLLSLYLAVSNAARLGPLNWAVVGLTGLAALTIGLLARPRPMDKRLAAAAVAVMAARATVTVLAYVTQNGLNSATFVFGIGLPVFFLWYLVAAIREMQQEPAAA